MTSLFSVLLLAAPAFKGPPVKEPRAALASKVQRFYEHAKDFSARFVQTTTYPTFGNVKRAAGKVFLKKPDLLRWEYDDGRLIVLDGKSLWNWNPEDKEASVKRAFGIAQVPQEFSFLFGKGNLLGEIGLFAPDGRRGMTIRCKTDVETARIDYDRFKELYFQNPQFGFCLLHLVVARLQGSRELLRTAVQS